MPDISELKNIIEGRGLDRFFGASEKEQMSDAVIDYLCKKAAEGENIGLDLIAVSDDKSLVDIIHNRAEKALRYSLSSRIGVDVEDKDIVFVSLCLIALLKYDGNFYDNVRTVYKDIYGRYASQKIENTIRKILGRIRYNGVRIIDTALISSVVPVKFLPDFFDFIFDIYKINFQYDIPGNPYNDFCFVYGGLRREMNSAGDELKLNVTKKKYKLIQATKRMVAQGLQTDMDAVAGLSMMVLFIIDGHYWNQELNIKNEYLSSGYKIWAQNFDKPAPERKRRERKIQKAHWEPKFELSGSEVFLDIPVHKIKAEYDYRDICIKIYNGQTLIYSNNQPDIREIIGGYKVSLSKVLIPSPLGELSYKITADENVIYNSKERLFRKVIVFSPSGEEIKNNTEYEGDAIFCYKEAEGGFEPYYSGQEYNLAYKNVDCSDFFVFEETLFSFSRLDKPGIFGEKIKDQHLKQEDRDFLIPVFFKVQYLVFESNNQNAGYEIIINNHRHRLNEYKYEKTEKSGITRFTVSFQIENPGIYNVEIYELNESKRSKTAAFEFAVDNIFSITDKEADRNIFKFDVCSGLFSEKINVQLNTENFCENYLTFEYNGVNYCYYFPIPINVYRIDKGPWCSVEKYLWADNISNDTVLDIFGTEADGVVVRNEDGECLSGRLLPENRKIYSEIRIGFLATYKNTKDYVVLSFLKDDMEIFKIICYFRCVYNTRLSEYYFNPENGLVVLKPVYWGRGNVIIEIEDSNFPDEPVYSGGIPGSGAEIEIEGLEPFERYIFYFYEKSKGLALKKKRLMFSEDFIFYTREGFIGRNYKIREIIYEKFNWGQCRRLHAGLKKTFVSFDEYIDGDCFLGTIYKKINNEICFLQNVNPVEIEICGCDRDGTVDLAITREGDGLLFNSKEGIKNTMDDINAPDIFSYTINLGKEVVL